MICKNVDDIKKYKLNVPKLDGDILTYFDSTGILNLNGTKFYHLDIETNKGVSQELGKEVYTAKTNLQIFDAMNTLRIYSLNSLPFINTEDNAKEVKKLMIKKLRSIKQVLSKKYSVLDMDIINSNTDGKRQILLEDES